MRASAVQLRLSDVLRLRNPVRPAVVPPESASQEVQQWRLGAVQRPVGTTYVPYDPSVETPDEGGANGR
jgi:hypothetical protein